MSRYSTAPLYQTPTYKANDKPLQGLINHVGIVIDASSSIEGYRLTDTMVEMVDSLVKHLAAKSSEMDQETRVTVYSFRAVPNLSTFQSRFDVRGDPEIPCLFYDKDVLRLPSIKDLYRPYGNTPLIDAALKAIVEMGATATLHGDHAFLLYVLTDGEENASRASDYELRRMIERLSDNWTLACYVPNKLGATQAEQFGFPSRNIQIWDTSHAGLDKVGESMRQTTDAYMQARASGVRGTRNLFTLDAADVDTRRLNILSRDAYHIYTVEHRDAPPVEIRPFVLSHGFSYQIGNTYYELIEPVQVQAHKEIAVLDGGKIYVGHGAREMLGLPHDGTVKVGPDNTSHNRAIFIQSTSVNRKLKLGQRVLVMK